MPSRTIHLSQHVLATNGVPTAVVLGGGINGLSVVRSLAQAELSPIVVVDAKYDVVSQFSRRFTVSTLHGEAFLKEVLGLRTGLPHGGILLFADDRLMLTVSRYRDRVARFLTSVSRPTRCYMN
jgi:D-aspartate ligase